MHYLKIFITSKEDKESNSNSLFLKLFAFFIPKANPNKEEVLISTKIWLLEFNDLNSTPNREIGLSEEGNFIIKMPTDKNYGYWTDSSLSLNDFKERFQHELIDKQVFDEYWDGGNGTRSN